ncbi:MAG: methionine biosynthesis protein MetW [bacterium]|nr:methionine biosynthesis protein MetW [bacterium]
MLDNKIISGWIPKNATVLDLGCGEGRLMFYLKQQNQAVIHGVEISEQCIYKCVGKGLSVFHSDIEHGLADFPDNSFDFVIFYQSLQQIKNLDFALNEGLRVGKKVIVGFPNFAYYKSRVVLLFQGKAPVTKDLPYRWDNTPNVHFFGIRDFKSFCKDNKIKIEQEIAASEKKVIKFMPNLMAERALFLLSKD